MQIFPSRYIQTPIIYRMFTASQPSKRCSPKIVKDLQECPSLKVVQVPIHIRFLLINYAEGFPKQVRMAHLAVIGSRKVNGVAEVSFLNVEYVVLLSHGLQLHSDLVKTTVLKDFVEFEGPSKSVPFYNC